MSIKAIAVLSGETVKGVVNFEQEYLDGPVRVHGEIKSLTKGSHALSVNQFGDLSNGCVSTGVHFNPTGKTHGAPSDNERHVGDLGNIIADDEGTAKFDFSDTCLRLNGPNSIIGRSVVVYNDVDDFGLGGVEMSRATGNSGQRQAAGVIGIKNPQSS